MTFFDWAWPAWAWRARRSCRRIAKLPFIKITAAADMRADAVAKFREQYKAEGYTSVEELCASPNVDAVYIATPNSLHAEHAIIAAEAQKTYHRRKAHGDESSRMRRHERSGG